MSQHQQYAQQERAPNYGGGGHGGSGHGGGGVASASDATLEARLAFMRRTYLHLGGAIGLFVLLSTALINSPLAEPLIQVMLGGRFSWLIVMGLFIGTGMLADWWARSVDSPPMQYLGLGLGVVSYSVIFVPMLYMAAFYSSAHVLPTAALITLSVFSVLTGFVLVSKRDFSMLRTGLVVMSALAMAAIAAGVIFGFSLGLGFSILMVGLSAGYVVYYTSNVLHHYRTDQHVAAALALFSAIAMMFWYILSLVMGRD